MANFVHPAVIRLVGNVGEAETAYLSAGCRSAVMACGRSDAVGGEVAECPAREGELVYLADDVPPAEWKAWVAGPLSERSACLIAGLYRSEDCRRAWEEVKRLDAVVLSFDLYDYGLVFYDRSKQRQHYIISF